MTTITTTSKVKSFLKSKGYPSKFRKDVHLLLNFGYKSVKSTLNTNTYETAITGRIAAEIENGLEKLNVLPESLLKPRYVVIPEYSKIKVKDPDNIKDEFIRLDIVILDNRRAPYMRYVIEAKRLKKRDFSQAIDKYCNKGIMRFVDGTYATTYPEAIMVSFLQDENINYWFNELIQKFKEDEKANQMNTHETLNSFQVIPEFQYEWSSIHKKLSGEDILLFHIFLDCF